MQFARFLLSCVFFFLFALISKSQTHTARTVNISGANCGGYYEYLPANYNSNTTTKYPILIYIHGNGAYGNGTASAMNIVLQEGVPRVINLGQFPANFTVNGQTSSFIVISPQFFSRASPLQTKNFIDYILNSNYRIDLNRVYLTGFSVGGDVAWKTPMNLASATRLAALCPVAGYNSPYTDTTAQFIAAGDLPVWAIHSNSDGVPVAWSQNMVDKINSYNPPRPAIITRPNNITHENTHIVVYDPTYRPNGKNIYEWMLQYSRNYPPIANAGTNQALVLPNNQTQLSSAGSADPEGTPLTFQWVKISGPSQFSISSQTAANPIISNLLAGVYQFRLTVTDGNGLSGYDTVQVSVINPNPNQLPLPDAGNDAVIYLPQTSVSLGGNGSFDPDGIIEAYAWQKISGPAQYTITNPASVNTDVINLKIGTYRFQLTVTDNEGGTSKDTVEVTVINPFPNILPVARAGNNQTITLPVNSVALSGAASTDADGAITAYHWRQVNGPSAAQLASPDLVNTNVGNLVAGLYQFELAVTDDSSGVGKDTVVITVGIEPPASENVVKVNLYGGSNPAGSDWNNWNVQSNLSLNSTFNANGTTSPVKATLNISNAIADNGATYPVTMCPTAVGRTSSYSTVSRWIILSGLDNNKRYNLEVYGSRSGTSTNSTRFIVDGTTITINTSNNYSNKAFFTNLAPSGGQIRLDIQRVNTYNYINGFVLSEAGVGSGGGGTGNIPPVVNPGNDQSITLPASSVTLNGTGSYDPDGTIVTYNWQKISGPAATIVNPGTASATATGLTAGTYFFQLTVTDNNGAIATGNVQVVVSPAYIPPAGSDSLNCGKVFKIVVLGSSTAVGTGSNPIDSSWVYKFRAYVRSKNSQNQVISLAASGFTTYHILNPTGYTAPAGRPSPDPERNITKALSLNPDLIIINLPSNDNASGYALQEQKDNYERTMALANAANVPVFVSTTQPRNNLTTAQMNNQYAMRDWTYERFGEKAIDFWTTIANPDGTINSLYNADGVHLTNAGHHILYSRAVAERMLDTLCLRKNVQPIAKAGNDIMIYLPEDSVQLSSAGSTDPDGTLAAYTWSKISGPSSYTIVTASSPNPKLRNLGLGVYQFELKVVDNLGAIAKDTVVITVTTLGPQAPVANAGSNTSVTLPVNSIQLSGAGSYDPDGTITAYAWRKIGGTGAYTMADSLVVNPLITNLVEGVYQFELTVTDNTSMTGKDSVSITVLPKPNETPVAQAGIDVLIPYPGNAVQLDGSLSIDPDGTIVSYRWKKIAGPAAFSISDSTIVNPQINGLAAGSYTIQLTVMDNSGAIGRDSVTVTVEPAPNQLPVANAGLDASIVLPATKQVSGAASFDPDGSIVSYSWSKVAGPASLTISNTSAVNPVMSNLSAGLYIFQLIVTDNSGAIAKDSVSLTVFPPLNTLPVARAGSDQSITLPVNSVTLNGTASSDQNGTIISYQWLQFAGPSIALLSNPSAAVTTAGNLEEGIYKFELTVTDDSSTTGKDTVIITVNPAPTVIQKFVQVNLYSGSNPAGTGWNNWNVQSSLSLNSTFYSDGTASPVRASLNLSNAIADNGATYPVTMCPVAVGRTSSYSTVSRWIILSGLDNNKTYNLEVYGSRSGTAVNSTRYIAGGTTITINTSNNYTNKALFSNLSPVASQIRLDIQRVNTYNYVNGFILTENTGTGSTNRFIVGNDPDAGILTDSTLEINPDSRNEIKIISTEKRSPVSDEPVFVYPNPFSDQFELQVNNKETGSISLSVVNQQGVLVRQFSFVKTGERFSASISVNDMLPGLYYIDVKMKNWRKSLKIVKQ